MSAGGPGFQNLIGQINASRQKQGMAPMPPATQPSNRFINKRTRPIQPGGPFVPRPDLGPGVGFGPGLPRPGVPMQSPMTGGPDPIPPNTSMTPQGLYNQYAKIVFGNGNPAYQPNFQPAPGGPFTPRPDLGPGVGFGPGLPQPMPNPEQSTFTEQINQGVSPIANAVGQPGSPTPQDMYNQYANTIFGQKAQTDAQTGFFTGNPAYQPNFQPTQATQQNPNVSLGFGKSASGPNGNMGFGKSQPGQGMASQTGPQTGGFNPSLGNTTLPGNF